ncbi:MAG: hypothetical protein QY318_00425 [Candidatus Dojkabacteria bacterium]|nr:MAG: hypothetical protein QY318_00425 [Candidatus Dojkabacteria bacterium]
MVLFSETESNITYTPGEPESINPAEFPPIEILGSVREVEHYILGEGSFGHGYFNDNYNMVINDEFYIRVDSVKAEASPYCVEDANPPDCTTDEYEYITPEIYIEYARQLLESLGMLETE